MLGLKLNHVSKRGHLWVTYGVNHWMKTDVKSDSMVWLILAFHCLNHIFKKLLWYLNCENMAIHFIEWHHTCIICKIMNGYHSWLFLVAVDIIRDKLPQWLNYPFGRIFCTTSLLSTKGSVYSTMGNKLIIWGPFTGFKCKHLFKTNLIHGNTNNIWHVYILAWPVLWRQCIRQMGQMTSLNMYSLSSFLVQSLDTKMYYVSNVDGNFDGKSLLCKFILYSIVVSFRKTISWN